MPETESQPITRRGALRTAAGAAVFGAAGVLGTGAAAAATDDTGTDANGDRGLRVKEKLLIVDRHGRQRFLHQTTKPPVHVNGITIPAEQRQGPENGSWFIFNDENQSEKGGLTASTNGVSFSLDYQNAEAVRLQTGYEGTQGHALLQMMQMPDPTIDPREVRPEDTPRRALLGWDNTGTGAALALFDSRGTPRILLQVDPNDEARILILDADGNVVLQLP